MYNFIFYFIFKKALKRNGNAKIPAAMFVWMAIMGHIFLLVSILKRLIGFNSEYSLILSGNYAKDEVTWITIFFIPSIYFIVKYYNDGRIGKLNNRYGTKDLYSFKNICLFFFLIFGGLVGGIILG